MRSNIDATITNTTRLGVDISGRVENTLNVGASQGIFQQLVRNTPVLLCRYPDGTFAVPDATHPNIVASNQPGGSYSKGNTFVVDARVELDQKLDFITSGLSEAAKELEMYGNAQNLAALEEKTGPMLAMYRSLKSLLRPYVEDNESSKKEVSSDDWITVLEQMHQRVEQFDMDGVDHAMETMDTFQTPDKLKDLMEQLRVCVADVEMEEIMKLTDTMVNLLQ